MKIICVEEHVIDPDIIRAVQPAAARLASYVPDLCTRFEDQPDSFGDGLAAPETR